MSPKLRVEMYYVYLYLREDRTPYYVGKGSGKRINQKHRFSDGKFLPLPPVDRRVIIKYFNDEEECFLFEEWLIEFYGRKIDGGILNNQCKGGGGCTRGRNFDRTKYNEKNKEKITARQKRYREKNKESLRQKQKENYQRRKEERGNYWYDNISKEEYNKKTRERYYRRKAEGYKRNDEERKKEYRKKNSEKQKAYMKEYYQKNKDKWNKKKIKDVE
jgi:hypothetical protein